MCHAQYVWVYAQYVWVYVLTHVHYVFMMHSLYVWSEDNFWELALSLYHLDSSAFSQVIRLSAGIFRHCAIFLTPFVIFFSLLAQL